MNTDILDKSYALFVSDGYAKSKEDFINLMNTNELALITAHNLFKESGNQIDLDEYKQALQGEPTVKKKEQSAPAQGQSQKKPNGVSKPADGSLVSPKPDDGSDWYTKSLAENTAQYLTPNVPKPTPSFTSASKMQEVVLPKKETSVDKVLSNMSSDMVSKEEEEVVPEMVYRLGDYGFKFEETGAMDAMSIMAPNGQKIEIDLDPILRRTEVSEFKKLKRFIRENAPQGADLDKIEQSFNQYNRKFYSKEEVKKTITSLNTEANNLNKEIEQYIKDKDQLDAEIKTINQTPRDQRFTPEYNKILANLTERSKEVEARRASLQKKQMDIQANTGTLEKSVGKYADMLASVESGKGNWLGAIWDEIMSGVGRIATGGMAGVSSVMDAVTETVDYLNEKMVPEEQLASQSDYRKNWIEAAKLANVKVPDMDPAKMSANDFISWRNSLTEDQRNEIDDIRVDKDKKKVKYSKDGGAGIVDEARGSFEKVLGDPTTTKEWRELKKQGFWGGAILGLAESLPSFVGGGNNLSGWAMRTARLFNQTSDFAMEEMSKNPEFDNIKEGEKFLVSAPIAIATAVLEEFGFRNAISKKGILNDIITSALGKAGKKTTATTFKELVENEIESRIARGLLVAGGAALAEAETGATQQAAEFAVKDIYNLVKDKDMFKTPESLGGYVKDILYSGAQEAVGGLILGMPSAISTAYNDNNFNGVSDMDMRLFSGFVNDAEIKRAIMVETKNKVLRGELTLEQGKKLLANYDAAGGLINSMPDNIDNAGKRKALSLLLERKAIESSITGKEEALIKPQKERIAEINLELEKISKDYAIQKQTTDESVLRQERSQMELQKMVEGDQVAQVPTQEGKKEEVKFERNLDESPEQNKGTEISNLKKQINGGLGTNMTLSPTEVSQVADTEFTVLPEEDIDKSDVNKPIILIRKRGMPNVTVSEAMAMMQEEGGPEALSDYFEIVDGRHRIKKAMRDGVGLNAVVITEAQYEEATGTKLYEKDTQSVLDDIGVSTIEEGITELESITSDYKLQRDYEKQTGRRAQDDLDNLSEEKRLRDTFDADETRAAAQPTAQVPTKEVKKEDVTIEPAIDDNGEIDYELEQQVRDIAKKRNLGITSDREIAYVAKDKDGNVIGGAFTSYDGDKYTFDVVVDEASESKGIGSKLLDAVKTIPSDISEQNPNAKVEVDVVSPTMKTMLESRGFKVDRKIGEDRFIMSPSSKTKVSGETITTETGATVQPTAQVAKRQVAETGVQEGAVGAVSPTAETATPVLEQAPETQKETFQQKAERLADRIRQSELPSWLAGIKLEDGTTIETKGVSVEQIKQKVADAVVEIGKLLDQGVSLVDAVKQKVDELVSIYGETKRREIETNMFREVSAMEDEKPEGYDRIMSRAKGVMDRSKERGLSNDEALDNVIKNIQANSTEYANATSIQQERIVRDIREMFGKKEKAAPSANRILGKIKDVTKITINEMTLLKKQMKDLARGAKDARDAWKNASAQLADEMRDLVAKGRISLRQSVAIINRFASVNMFNQASIDKFVDYMARIMENAEYSQNLSDARAMLPRAKKNLRKLGIAEGLMPALQKMLSVDPRYIPDSVFGKYRLLLEMLSKRDAVLALEEITKVKTDVNDILDALNQQESEVYVLRDVFDNYQDKQLNDDGTVNFTDTINQMVEDGIIDQKTGTLMKKYESFINPTERETKEYTEQEIDQMREDVKNSQIDSSLISSRLERDLVSRLKRLIETNAVDTLSGNELNNLLRIIDNINNGYVPHMAQIMVERLEANTDGDIVERAIKRAKLPPLSKAYAKVKKFVLRKKDAVLTMIERNPFFVIDQVLGDFKTKEVFNAVFQKIASASSRYESEVKKISERLNKVEQNIFKANRFNHNKTMMSKFKIMTYLLEKEYLSNPGNKGVAKASDFIKKTIELIKTGESQFPERDAVMLQELLDNKNYFDSEGNVDMDNLYDSFNIAEQDAISEIQDINRENADKATYAQVVIRGEKMDLIDNYVHHNVIPQGAPDQNITDLSGIVDINRSMMPSTRGKSLMSRKPGAKAINFDPFQATQRGADYVLLDFYMTEPIRVMRKAINFAKTKAKENNLPEDKQKILNAISKAAEQTIHNTLANHYMSSSLAMDALNYLKKTGYRAILASAPRFVGELTSNLSYALFANPKSFFVGVSPKVRGIMMSSLGADVMKNVGSVQVTRLYPSDLLSGRMIDTSIMQEAMGRKSRTKNTIANKMNQINNWTLKPVRSTIEKLADAIISTPDKMISRPIWFGSFSNEFKSLTGRMPDFDLIAENDEAYMNDNAEAIAIAKQKADVNSIQAGASDNAFVGILKGAASPDQDAVVRGFNMFNNFMTRFMIYEYTTARTGITAMVGNGSITKREGAALLAAVTSRMMLYSLITTSLSNGMIGLFVDEDEEDEKSVLQKIAQSMIGAFTSMTIGRDFGNATRSVLNYGIERVNENYFDFLREGDYDPYKDMIQYDPFPKGGEGKTIGIEDYIIAMSGAYAPLLKTAELTIKSFSGPPKKESDAIERLDRTLYERIPLEWAGHFGLIPMYKDVRKIIMKDMYKGLDKKEEKKKDDISKQDLKKYYPDEYKRLYGDKEKMEKEMKKAEKEMFYGRNKPKSGGGSDEVYYGRTRPKSSGNKDEIYYGRNPPKD